MEKKAKKKQSETFDAVKHDIVVLLWVGFAAIASQFIVGYPMLWILGKANFSSPLWTTIYAMLVYVCTAFLVIFVPKFVKKEWGSTRESLGLTELPTFTDIGISILGFIVTIFISGIVLNILQSMNLVDASQAQNVGYSHLANGFDRAVAFIALVVITPFAEEVIFRGWLYRRLKNKSGVAIAIALTALLFGALHGQWNVGITVGIMSVVMCIEQELTGTIYAGVLTHMIKNGVAFWLLYIVMA